MVRGGKIRLSRRPQPQFWWDSYLKSQYLLSLALGRPSHVNARRPTLQEPAVPVFVGTHNFATTVKALANYNADDLHGFAAQRLAFAVLR